ncbi:hypothetical protein DI392_00770 [Vibrio albus]|uniref:Holin n=1 Tax=Vibrio albus TaxID=2200953 RepID=A0A2U3BDH3_9VIBR|nr:hypothetical protein [Vibrio albus]PWI34846.1 hypothetical protein DI392_00770 [Vibrio albus]
MMKFSEAWKRWSFKAAVIAALLNVVLIFLPFFQMSISPVTYATVNAVLMVVIAILRVWPQSALADE